MAHPSHPLQLVLGPLICAVWFVAMYASLSVVCQVAPPPQAQGALTWINGKLLVLTLLVGLLLLLGGLRCRRQARAVEGLPRLLARVAAGAYLFTAAATLLIGLPVVALPPCV